MSDLESVKRLERWLCGGGACSCARCADIVEAVALIEAQYTALREKDKEIARLKAQVTDLLRSIPESEK